MEYKPLPIGIDSFEKLIEENCYYVDKTSLIQKLLDTTSEVSLFTRPRRFGKSLNLSMLQCFFEKSEKDKSYLFEGLDIASSDEKYVSHMGKYPVIMLNFKEGKQATFESSYSKLKWNIAREFARHNQILNEAVLSEQEIKKYSKIQNEEAEQDLMIGSVQFLSECLEKAYGEKAIILIDEYDVPLENAHFRGFYQEMIDFIRGLLSVALKTNQSLQFAVMTGCLRISKESIFTGLNNLEIISIQNEYYGEYFGFTYDEVAEMLKYYDKEHHANMIKEWYDGYLFGDTEVYNPWSLINHVKQILVNDKKIPMPYWSNTSSNSIIRDLVERADMLTKSELEILVSGGTIEKPIQEDITYGDIYKSSDNLWNFLFFIGYLRKVNEWFEAGQIFATLRIPNSEVLYIYRNHIMEWSRERIEQKDLTELYEATLKNDCETVQREIKKVLMEVISFYDSGSGSDNGESFYHGIMLGLYRGIKDYMVLSNRESGNGRPDMILKYPTFDGKAYIFEFKVARKPTELELAAEEALQQIEKQDYVQGLYAEGYSDITKYGIGFFRKNCMVKMQ